MESRTKILPEKYIYTGGGGVGLSFGGVVLDWIPHALSSTSTPHIIC